MAFNYFSSGTGSQNFPKPNVGPPKYNKSYSASARAKTTQRQNTSHYGTRSGGGGTRSYSNYAPPQPPANPYRGSGGGGVSGGVGSNSSGRISSKAPPPPAKPAAPALTPAQKAAQEAAAQKKYLLTDTAYKSQNDLLTKAATDYLTQKTSQENQYNTQYTTNAADLDKQQGVDYGNTEADYAARGMGAGSGSAQKALSDLLDQYKNRKGQLLTDKNNFLGNLGSAYTNFQGEQTASRERYKQEALARRAAALGL